MITREAILRHIWEKSCLLWAWHHRLKSETGSELRWRNHRFLQDIYDDWTPIQAVRKAGQIGFSVMNIIKSFYAAGIKKHNIIYTLPSFSDVSQFVPSKVNPIISNNPLFTDLTKDKDSTFQKKIGDRFIFYRGTLSTKSEEEKAKAGVGIMFSADLLVFDEADRSDQDMLVQYESRLSASQYGGRWYFSNPTVPHTLTQKLYEQSDQKHWFVKCDNGHWQYLDFWKNIKNGKFVCQNCEKEITDENRRQGQWVKKYQNRDVSGYWISHLMAPWISAQQIQNEYENKPRQFFYNFVLGLPYVGSEHIVNQDIILRNISQDFNLREGNVLGVDSGLKKHYVLGNKQGIFDVGVVDDWKNIENIIRIYDVKTAIIDALPDLTEPRKLRDKYVGKIWLHYFKKDVRSADFVKWDKETRTVYSDRTKTIQQVMQEFIDGKIGFNLKAERLEEYIRHWQTLYKLVKKDSLGLEQDFWESSGEDHFVFATLYFYLALEQAGGDVKTFTWRSKQKEDPNVAPDIKKIIKEAERQRKFIKI